MGGGFPSEEDEKDETNGLANSDVAVRMVRGQTLKAPDFFFSPFETDSSDKKAVFAFTLESVLICALKAWPADWCSVAECPLLAPPLSKTEDQFKDPRIFFTWFRVAWFALALTAATFAAWYLQRRKHTQTSDPRRGQARRCESEKRRQRPRWFFLSERSRENGWNRV